MGHYFTLAISVEPCHPCKVTNQRKIQPNQVPAYYSDILQRYNISKTRFDVSLRFYSDDLEKFDKMYDEILSLLNKRQAEMEAGK